MHHVRREAKSIWNNNNLQFCFVQVFFFICLIFALLCFLNPVPDQPVDWDAERPDFRCILSRGRQINVQITHICVFKFSVQHAGSDKQRAAVADLQVVGWTGQEISLDQLNCCNFPTIVSAKCNVKQ